MSRTPAFDIALDRENTEVKNKGMWVEIHGPQAESLCRVKVRCQNSQDVTARKKKAKLPLTMSREPSVGLLECLIVDWEGILKDGKDFPFNKTNLRTLAEDENLADLHGTIIEHSLEERNFCLRLEEGTPTE